MVVGGWWLVYVPQLDTVGHARTLAETDAVAREVVGLYLNADPDSVNVTVEVHG